MTYPPQDPQNPYTPAQPPYDPTQTPAQPQYGQAQPPAPSYGQPQYGQQPHEAPQYGQPQYGQPYEAPQSPAQPQYGQPYEAPQSPAQPQYGQPYEAPGQPQYGQPQYGQQPYDASQSPGQPQYYQPGQGQQAPYQQAYGQPALPQKTNGFAIASLIFGIIGGILFAIIFGIVALSQIKKRNEKGKGMAITGLALSGVWIVVCGLLVALGAFSDGFNFGQAPRDDKGTITDKGDVSAKSIKLGDCVNDLEEGTVESLKAVPCAQPHDAEVYAEFRLTGSTYPGDTKVEKDAEDGCSSRFKTAVAAKYQSDESIGIYYLYPSKDTWAKGDRVVSCFAEDTDGQLTGSVRK